MAQHGFGPDAMRKIKVCGSCGMGADAEQQFCKECGARLNDTTLFDLYKKNHLYCPDCGTVLPDSARFCSHCGRKFTDK